MYGISLLGFKLPKYGKVFLHEELGKLVFNPMLDDKTHSRKITASPKKERKSNKVFSLIGKSIFYWNKDERIFITKPS